MMVDEQLGIEFGKIVRERRATVGLSQERLALDSGLDRTYISMLESGKRQPSLATIIALARCLDVLPSEILREIEAG